MPMNKRGLVYAMEKTENVTKLYLYDTVTKYGKFNWETWQYDDSETSAKAFRDQLDEIPDGTEIHLHINSMGGEVGEGVTIYNLLRQKSQAGSKIVGFVDGTAYSVAADIAMAADELHMGLGTSMLLHYPWMYAAGNADQLREYADQLDALGEASVQLYMKRAKDLTEDDMREMMRKETMLDPESCLKYGFCDIVDDYKPEEPDDKIDPDRTAQQLQRMKEELQEAIEQAHQEKMRAERLLMQQKLTDMKPEEKPQEKGTVAEVLMKALNTIGR